jgi:hypothetical protein
MSHETIPKQSLNNNMYGYENPQMIWTLHSEHTYDTSALIIFAKKVRKVVLSFLFHL